MSSRKPRSSCILVDRLFWRPGLGLAVAAFVASVPLACRDTESTAPMPLRIPAAMASASVSDSELNYNDSWVSATQTVAETTVVNMDEAFIDPVTGQATTQMILAEDPQQVPALAGYGYDGRFRVTTGYATSDGIEIGTVRQIDDATSDIDQAGETSTIVLDREPAAELGTLVDAQVDVTTNSNGGFSCNTDCTQVASIGSSQQRSPESGFTAPSRTVTQLSENHVRVTEIWLAKSAGPRPAQLQDPIVRQDRDYQKRGADWLLSRVRSHAKIRQGDSESEYIQTVTMTDVRWNRNPVEDAKRKARRESRVHNAGSTKTPPSQILGSESCDPTTAVIECDSEGSGEGGSTSAPSGYPYEPRIYEASLVESDATTNIGVGDVTLVLQHGFWSSSDTWRRMHTWLATDVSVGSIIRKTLPWRETFETQAAALHKRLRSEEYIPGRVILMGHSNGGMVNRYLGRNPDAYNEAQATYAYEPLNIGGVVTVGTPHKGVPLANFAPGFSHILGWGGSIAKIVCTWHDMAGCMRFGELANAPISGYVEQYRGRYPVMAQSKPNSAYHADFNSQPESFQRYGVQSYLRSTKWQLWGLNGAMSCYTWDPCGAPAEVKKTDRIYKRDISCAITGIFVLRWQKAAKCALDAVVLKSVDLTAKRHLGVADYTDGVVPRWSQLYPNIPMEDQFEIYGGPNHVEETKSFQVFSEFKKVLGGRFGLFVRQ